jgi:hypothetical protein
MKGIEAMKQTTEVSHLNALGNNILGSTQWTTYKLHNLYSSPNIINITEPMKMRWTEHVARM